MFQYVSYVFRLGGEGNDGHADVPLCGDWYEVGEERA